MLTRRENFSVKAEFNEARALQLVWNALKHQRRSRPYLQVTQVAALDDIVAAFSARQCEFKLVLFQVLAPPVLAQKLISDGL